MDGKAISQEYTGVSSPIFSPFNNRLSYIAARNGKMFIVENGVAASKYERVSNLSFSPNGKRLAYLAKGKGNRWHYIVEGHPTNAYDVPPFKFQFSPDNRHFAFFGKRGGKFFMSIDGKDSKPIPQPINGSRPVFDSSTNLHTIIRRGKQFIRLEIEIKG